MINEIQPKIKFQNIVQCPFKTFKPLKLSDWMWKTGKNVILNNVDYLWKTKDTTFLSDNISEVVLSATIKDANAVAICACVTEFMI